MREITTRSHSLLDDAQKELNEYGREQETAGCGCRREEAGGLVEG